MKISKKRRKKISKRRKKTRSKRRMNKSSKRRRPNPGATAGGGGHCSSDCTTLLYF